MGIPTEKILALNDYAAMVLTIQLFIAGLCFTGPVFNTQLGIRFWLVTAVLLGSERTLMLYADDAEAVLAGLDHDAFPTESALVRRATLEDVFLRLTGRTLRE